MFDAHNYLFTLIYKFVYCSIGTILKAGPKEVKEDLKPYCSYSSSSSSTLDYLTTTILKHRLPNVAETSLAKWLSLMANDRHASLKQLSTKIAFALQEVSSYISELQF